MVSSGTLVTLAPTADEPEGLAATGRDCQAVGAAVLVLPALEPGAAREAVAAVREETDLLVQASDPALGADLLTVPLGAPQALLDELLAEARLRGAVPVFEAGTLGQLDALPDPADPAGPLCVSLLLGGRGELPGTLASVASCLERLPAGVVWSATGRGPAALPVLLAALAGGGHVRAGSADTPEPGDPARADLQLVARAAGLARIAQRPPVPPPAARTQLLGPPTGPVAPRSAPDPTSVEIR